MTGAGRDRGVSPITLDDLRRKVGEGAICSCHSALSEAGATTRTRSMPRFWRSNAQAAIACTVLPSPMSSASSARSEEGEVQLPSR